MLKKYKNSSGSSGVIAYESGATWIKVKFITGAVYRYSYNKPGKQHVDQMKKLAREGRGFATYISQNVKDAYESYKD